ncbi:hypothetical protein PMAYCL1PPCAC_27636, partial [Pristionchus mayeri]
LITLITMLSAVAQCPPNFVMLSTGVQCYTNEYCAALSVGYTCENNVCCSRQQRDNFCQVGQVSINDICFAMVNINEPCAYSQQCIGSCRNPSCHREGSANEKVEELSRGTLLARVRLRVHYSGTVSVLRAIRKHRLQLRNGEDVPWNYPSSPVQGGQFVPVCGHAQLRVLTE